VQLPGDSSNLLAQKLLDVHVDVFAISRKHAGACFQVGADCQQPRRDLFRLVRLDYSALPKHFHMSETTNNVVRPKARVEVDARVKIIDRRLRLLTESTGPQFAHSVSKFLSIAVIYRAELVSALFSIITEVGGDAHPISLYL
jgi:hypothetical protein